MNMPLYSAARLITVGAFALMVPMLASATGVGEPDSFKLAMGPMSAPQKNQSQQPAVNSDQVQIKPHHHVKTHRHGKRRHHGQ